MGQIKLLLTKSDLSSKQQNELLAILKLLPMAEVDELADFLVSNPEWIVKLYNNYKQKNMSLSIGTIKTQHDLISVITCT